VVANDVGLPAVAGKPSLGLTVLQRIDLLNILITEIYPNFFAISPTELANSLFAALPLPKPNQLRCLISVQELTRVTDAYAQRLSLQSRGHREQARLLLEAGILARIKKLPYAWIGGRFERLVLCVEQYGHSLGLKDFARFAQRGWLHLLQVKKTPYQTLGGCFPC
jgi:hypothetical protein